MEELFQQIPAFSSVKILSRQQVQNLWDDYGAIARLEIDDGKQTKSLIIKYIAPPEQSDDPVNHQRKIDSYKFEQSFYEKYGNELEGHAKIPKFCGAISMKNERLFVLEDLKPDYPKITAQAKGPYAKLTDKETSMMLDWLACFHARFLNSDCIDLPKIGTYWHLETRKIEFERMNDGPLKIHAHAIHNKIVNSKFRTFVHGDAKPPNFLFGETGVAGVDFQWVGPGCGLQDIWYYFAGMFDEETEKEDFNSIMDIYFSKLGNYIKIYEIEVDFISLENEWRSLLPFIVADFERFLIGRFPGKISFRSTSLAKSLTSQAVAVLNTNNE